MKRMCHYRYDAPTWSLDAGFKKEGCQLGRGCANLGEDVPSLDQDAPSTCLMCQPRRGYANWFRDMKRYPLMRDMQ